VAEVIGKDPGEQAEAKEDEDFGGGHDEEESPRNQTTVEKRRHGEKQHEDGGREPLLPENCAQKEEEHRFGEREEHGDRGVEEVSRYGSWANQRRIPREGRDRRRRLEGPARELQGFPGDGRENAEQGTCQEHSADQRIGEAAREQACPGNQRVGPAAPDERLESDVQQPTHAGEEEGDARAQEKQGELRIARHVAR
jgi:hypothetical protein